MRKTYDTMILGCGEAGVFAGYELIRRNPGMKVLIVDQGQDIYHRSCPIVAGKVRECIDCKVCHTMCGFGGAGAFSDGKYNFTTAFGGWLTDFMPEQEVMELIDYVDEINTAHGATREVFSTETPAAQALRKRPWNLTSTSSRPGSNTWARQTTCGFSPTLYEDLRRDSPSSSTPPSPPSARQRGGTAWRQRTGTSIWPSSSSPPPAGPGQSGLPSSAVSWACP